VAHKYKLLAQHHIEDMLLEPGTIIGEGTSIPFLHKDGSPRPPTPDMEGLDEESQKAIEAVVARFMNPELSIPLTMDQTEVEFKQDLQAFRAKEAPGLAAQPGRIIRR
jgi:hypothetical protein